MRGRARVHVCNSGTDAFAGQKVDGVRPTFSHAATSLDGASVVVTFSENIQATTAVNDDFTVTVAGTEATLTGSPSVSDRAVTLTVGTAITAGQTVTVAYTDPSADDDTAAVQDAAGNDAASVVSRN